MIGVPFEFLANTRQVVGNTLPLRLPVTHSHSFVEHVRSLQEIVRQALTHSRVSLEIVGRQLMEQGDHDPLFQLAFAPSAIAATFIADLVFSADMVTCSN